MRSRRRLAVVTLFLAFLALSAGVVPAARQRRPGVTPAEACAFRTAGLQSLWDADSEAGLAAVALATGDLAAAQTAAAAAVGALRHEARRARHARRSLPREEARTYLHEFDRLLHRATTVVHVLRGGRRAEHRGGVVSADVTGAAAGIRNATAQLEATLRATGCLPGSLTLARLFVAEGEEHRVPGGLTITAEDGIEMRGRLVVEPPGGDLTLTAQRGDVLLAGSITYQQGTVASGRDSLAVAAPPPSGRPVRLLAPSPSAPAAGGSILITAMTGNVIVGPTYFAIAGDGRDASDLVLGSYTSPLRFRGADGGAGGSIQLAAPAGTVRILPRAAGDPPPFQLGNGGHGQNVTLASGTFETPWPTLAVNGGKGGDSGRLTLQGHLVQNQNGTRQLIAGARGGDGGSVVWDTRGGTTVSALTETVLVGGFGGGAEIRGGDGGAAIYLSGRVINAVGTPVAHAGTTGGFGGNVYGPGVAEGLVAGARGGNGGDALVEGNSGWDGTGPTAPDGARGGSVIANAGWGGAVVAPPGALADDLPSARGGDGGAAIATSGAGGNGAPSCPAGLPGSRGGDAGSLTLDGGHGGDAPTTVSPGVTTYGGSGGTASPALGRPGRGGDGSPPGACGDDSADPTVQSAPGGTGTQPGRLGNIAATERVPCAGPPVPCSVSTTTVTTIPPPTTTVPPCGDRLNYAEYELHVFPDGSHSEIRIMTTCTALESTGTCTTWHEELHVVSADPLGNVTTHDEAYDKDHAGPGSSGVDDAWMVFCARDGSVIWPDGTTYTVEKYDHTLPQDEPAGRLRETDTFSCSNCDCAVAIEGQLQPGKGNAVCCLTVGECFDIPLDMCATRSALPGGCEVRQGLCAEDLVDIAGPPCPAFP